MIKGWEKRWINHDAKYAFGVDVAESYNAVSKADVMISVTTGDSVLPQASQFPPTNTQPPVVPPPSSQPT